MQEHLLYIGSGGGGGIPGPSDFIGYTEEDDKGFFGEVTGSELITMSSLTSQLGVTQGTAQNLDTPWLKFYLDGRILFVAKKTIRHTISYKHLRDRNLVNGSRIITINGLQYRVGLLGGLNDGYTGSVSTGGVFNQPYTMRSEWTRLMYNVASDVGIPANHRKQGQIGDNWAEYPQDHSANGLTMTTGNGCVSWCKELRPADSSRTVVRGYVSVSLVAANSSSSALVDRGWRPMLELIKE